MKKLFKLDIAYITSLRADFVAKEIGDVTQASDIRVIYACRRLLFPLLQQNLHAG